MTQEEVIHRLCLLQEKVYRVIDKRGRHSCDCFCEQGGFWGDPLYGGIEEKGYRNDGFVLRFIERATNKALKEYQEK